MSCKIRLRRHGDTPLVELEGDVTVDDIAAVSKKIKSLQKGKALRVAIDLSETTFIDSHGLGVFVYFWKTFEEQKRELVFLNPPQFLRTMFEGTNLNDVFRIVDSLEDL
jgi:anti-sigma B factor antagonist